MLQDFFVVTDKYIEFEKKKQLETQPAWDIYITMSVIHVVLAYQPFNIYQPFALPAGIAHLPNYRQRKRQATTVCTLLYIRI